MTKTTVKSTEDNRAMKKVTTKQLKTKKSAPLPSTDEAKLPKRKRQVADSDSSTDEEERVKKHLTHRLSTVGTNVQTHLLV